MKKNKLLLLVLMIVIVCVFCGCSKKEVHTIEANQTAFLIPLKGNTANQASFESEELLGEAKVATKQVYITYSRERLGPLHREWVPDNMLIIVDRTPVTREWSEAASVGTSSNNQAIYAESKESIGFSVGMNCSAQIYSEEDAVKFLYSYNNKTLADIMDSEIRARVNIFISDFSSSVKGERPNDGIVRKYIKAGIEYLKTLKPYPFKVVAVEEKIDFEIGGIQMTAVVDVLGQDDDGEYIIIDNKSRDLKPRSNREKPTMNDI